MREARWIFKYSLFRYCSFVNILVDNPRMFRNYFEVPNQSESGSVELSNCSLIYWFMGERLNIWGNRLHFPWIAQRTKEMMKTYKLCRIKDVWDFLKIPRGLNWSCCIRGKIYVHLWTQERAELLLLKNRLDGQ